MVKRRKKDYKDKGKRDRNEEEKEKESNKTTGRYLAILKITTTRYATSGGLPTLQLVCFRMLFASQSHVEKAIWLPTQKKEQTNNVACHVLVLY